MALNPDHLKRILSGVVALPIFFAVIYWGHPFWFFLLAVLAILIGTYEYFTMASHIGAEGFPRSGLVLSFLLTVCFYFQGQFISEWLILSLIVISAAWMVSETNIKLAVDQMAYTLWGVIFVAGTLGHFILIRQMENGSFYLLYVFMVVWIGDIASFYGGQRFGKRQLSPVISPKKTVEGAFLGILGSLLAGLAAQSWFLSNILLSHCLIMAFFCGIIGQFGDLTESILKRNAGIKDSGDLIPGHGGILDRVDGLIFAGPFFYYYVKWVISG